MSKRRRVGADAARQARCREKWIAHFIENDEDPVQFCIDNDISWMTQDQWVLGTNDLFDNIIAAKGKHPPRADDDTDTDEDYSDDGGNNPAPFPSLPDPSLIGLLDGKIRVSSEEASVNCLGDTAYISIPESEAESTILVCVDDTNVTSELIEFKFSAPFKCVSCGFENISFGSEGDVYKCGKWQRRRPELEFEHIDVIAVARGKPARLYVNGQHVRTEDFKGGPGLPELSIITRGEIIVTVRVCNMDKVTIICISSCNS